MPDSQTLRAIGTDPLYTKECAEDAVRAVRTILQLLVIEGWITPQRADELAQMLYGPFKAIALRLAWYYYNTGYKRGQRDMGSVGPIAPIPPPPEDITPNLIGSVDPKQSGPVLRPTVSFSAVVPPSSLPPRKAPTK